MRAPAVFPELVTGREDNFVAKRWRVDLGSTLRGDASCNLTERVLQVPWGEDPVSRVVRAHELVHARVSPHALAWAEVLGDVSPRALECAEEFRVNTLLARLGFDVALLRDGTEKVGARRLGSAGEWDQAVCFLLAVLGTGAERDFLAGIRSTQPSWSAGLRALRQRAIQLVGHYTTDTIGATILDGEGIPRGYAAVSVVLARLLTQTMAASVPQGSEALRQFRRSLAPGGRRPPTGRFAPLVFDRTVTTRCRPRSRGLRRASPRVSGTVMRYPNRLLLDPHQRAFAGARHPHGGVVVVDQSGSMDIDHDQLVLLMKRAPDATVVGYSHRPGDLGATPNVWVLADRRGVAVSCPSGNVGNGVDGPVVAWALSQRRGREPLVWVTDGQITDSHDHPDEILASECARLVLEHGIILARDLADVARMLRAPISVPAWNRYGRLGRKILEIQE